MTILGGLPWPGLAVSGTEDHVTQCESLGLLISSEAKLENYV